MLLSLAGILAALIGIGSLVCWIMVQSDDAVFSSNSGQVNTSDSGAIKSS